MSAVKVPLTQRSEAFDRLEASLVAAMPSAQVVRLDADRRLVDLEWVDELPGEQSLVVAEGVFGHLDQSTVVRLLRRLSERSVHGHVVFDAPSKVGLLVQWMRPRSRKLTWGIDDPYDLPKWCPRLRFVDQHAYEGGRILHYRF